MREAMEYLGKRIAFDVLSSTMELPAMNKATLLLWLPGWQMSTRGLAGSILVADPLAVMIAGYGAEQLFDHVLARLSEEPTPRPMLTRLSRSDLDESVVDFLQGTWPYESRMDEWDEYRLVCAEEDMLAMRNATTGVLSDRTDAGAGEEPAHR